MIGENQDSGSEAKTWVDKNRAVVEETYQRFLRTGEWPTVTELQRHFDQYGASLEVQEVVNSKPRVTNEARLVHPERLTLELRHLMWIENVRPLVSICVRAIQRAVEAYLSDVEEPVVTSDDALVVSPSDPRGSMRNRAYQVLTRENPSPFGGSGMRDDGWEIQVDSRFARRFRDVASIEDFVTRQDAIRGEIAQEAAAMAQGFPVEVFTGTVLDSDLAIPGVVPEPSAVKESVPRVEGPDWWIEAESQERKPVLFLSWGRATSKAVANKLKPMLDMRLPGVDVFFSPTSIEPGADPSRRLFHEGLLVSRALLVVLTADGAGSAYVIWETATAWARDQLVIPLFVDIEPAAVPGPLTSKVQGVHLHDREDIDRGIQRLATHFGVPVAQVLTEKEYADLLTAARTPEEEDPEENLRTLRKELRGYLARWHTLFAGFEQSHDLQERIQLASEIHHILLGAVQVAMTNSADSPLGLALGKIAQEAAGVKRIRVLSDGGRSFRELTDGCRDLIASVESVIVVPTEPTSPTKI